MPLGFRPANREIELRDKKEIQRAHDLLALILDPFMPPDLQLNEPLQLILGASTDVLCWALNHENDNFDRRLASLEAMLRERGMVLNDAGQLFVRAGPRN